MLRISVSGRYIECGPRLKVIALQFGDMPVASLISFESLAS
jgi:hypothetical protein